MLRSIFIGFAIAAMLQVGLYSATSTHNLVLAQNVKAIGLECDSAALLRTVTHAFGIVAR